MKRCRTWMRRLVTSNYSLWLAVGDARLTGAALRGLPSQGKPSSSLGSRQTAVETAHLPLSRAKCPSPPIYPLSLRQAEGLLHERGIDICHETARFWWNRFGPMFAAEIRKRRVDHRSYSNWRWHLDELFVRINGESHYLWRAVDHEGEVLEVFATKRRDRMAALTFLKRAMKRYDRPRSLVTDRLRSYRAAMRIVGVAERQECGRWLNNRAESSHQPFRRQEGAMAKFRGIKTL